MSSQNNVVIYKYRGLIEKITSTGRVSWIEGYSADGENGAALYPWMGKRDCQKEAKQQRKKALFVFM